MKIWKAKVVENVESEDPAGTVIQVEKDGFTVKCGENGLKVLELQIPGKKRMDASAFLRGYEMPVGTVLTGKE